MVPDSLTTVSAPAFDEGEFLETWEPETRHRAAKSASRSGLHNGEADDLTQEVLLAILRAARKKGPLNERYVRRLTTRVLQSEWRKRERIGREISIGQLVDERREPLAELDPLRQVAMARQIRALPSRQQAIFEAIYRDGLTQNETAQVIGVSQPRVAVLHARLLEWGREELAGIAA